MAAALLDAGEVHQQHNSSCRKITLPPGKAGTVRNQIGIRSSKFSDDIISFARVMAKLKDLKLQYRSFMRLYRYRSYDWSPGVQLGKELSRCRLAVVTTAAGISAGGSL